MVTRKSKILAVKFLDEHGVTEFLSGYVVFLVLPEKYFILASVAEV